MADTPVTETTPPPGPAHSATSDTPDFVLSRPPISASGQTGGETPDVVETPVVETPAPDTTEPAPAETPAEDDVSREAGTPEAPPEPPAAADGVRKDTGVGKVLNAKDAEIARLSAEKDALQRQFNEALLKRDTAPPEAPKPPVEVKPDLRPVRPKPAQFESPDAYEAALDAHEEAFAGWTARQAQAASKALLDADRAIQDQQSNNAKVTQDFVTVQQAHEARLQKAVEKYADFAEVAFANDVSISPSMGILIMNSGVGPDLMYHLGQHKDEAARIANLVMPGQFHPKGHEWAGMPVPNVVAQAREMGKLEGRLSAQAAPPAAAEVKPRQISRAPAPVKPVAQRSTALPKSPEEMTADEYFENHPSTRARRAAAAARGATTH